MIRDGWLDWADTSVRGHPAKVYGAPNAGLGIILHSIVGDLPGYSVPHRFLADDRLPDGRFTPYAAASVMFILYRDGYLRQLYPVTASTWTSGGYEANTGYWSVELEGGFEIHSEPITLEAALSLSRLALEFEQHTGRTLAPSNLIEHREAAARWNYAPTACASGRYDWWRKLIFERGTQMTITTIDRLLQLDDRVARLERLLAGWGHLEIAARPDNLQALSAVTGKQHIVGETVRLTGLATLAYLDLMQNNMWMGLQNAQREIAEIKQNAAKG